MRNSEGSSDVCSSDLAGGEVRELRNIVDAFFLQGRTGKSCNGNRDLLDILRAALRRDHDVPDADIGRGVCAFRLSRRHGLRQRRSNLCLSGGLRVCRGPAERTSRAEHQPNFDAAFHIVPLTPSLFFASWLAALAASGPCALSNSVNARRHKTLLSNNCTT